MHSYHFLRVNLLWRHVGYISPFFGTLGILVTFKGGGKVIFRLSRKVPITKSLFSMSIMMRHEVACITKMASTFLITCSFLKKQRQESALRTKNLRLHFEISADAQPGVVVGTIERLNFHKQPDIKMRMESSKRTQAKFMGSILRNSERSWTLARPNSSSSQPLKYNWGHQYSNEGRLDCP